MTRRELVIVPREIHPSLLLSIIKNFVTSSKHLCGSLLNANKTSLVHLHAISLFACWFQPELISQSTVFFSHNKPASTELISPKTDQQTG